MTQILTWDEDIQDELCNSAEFVLAPAMHTEWHDKYDCLVVYDANDTVIAVNYTENDDADGKDTWYLLTKKLSRATSKLQATIRGMAKRFPDKVKLRKFPDEESFRQTVINEVGISI